MFYICYYIRTCIYKHNMYIGIMQVYSVLHVHTVPLIHIHPFSLTRNSFNPFSLTLNSFNPFSLTHNSFNPFSLSPSIPLTPSLSPSIPLTPCPLSHSHTYPINSSLSGRKIVPGLMKTSAVETDVVWPSIQRVSEVPGLGPASTVLPGSFQVCLPYFKTEYPTSCTNCDHTHTHHVQ